MNGVDCQSLYPGGAVIPFAGTTPSGACWAPGCYSTMGSTVSMPGQRQQKQPTHSLRENFTVPQSLLKRVDRANQRSLKDFLTPGSLTRSWNSPTWWWLSGRETLIVTTFTSTFGSSTESHCWWNRLYETVRWPPSSFLDGSIRSRTAPRDSCSVTSRLYDPTCRT